MPAPKASVPSPFQRMVSSIKEDRNDLLVLLTYTVFSGLLFLAVPIGAQVLVNSIATGVLVQPVILLSVLVLMGLLFGGTLRLLQFYIVELMQQRIFVRIALRLARHITNIKHSLLAEQYGPELANRFFETLTIQKTLSKLLLDGPAALLQVSIGLVLMGIYSPLLLAFDIFLVLSVILIALAGRGGVQTSITESGYKYRLAHWLEELARCHISFKMVGCERFRLDRTDGIVVDYLDARRRHFRILFRQTIGYYLLQAFASAGILAIGGWLVMNHQLTLGQLVAAELIVIMVLSALDKLVSQLSMFYDLLTGYEKVGQVTDLSTERRDGAELPKERGATVRCHHLHFSFPDHPGILKDINLELKQGQCASLVGVSGSGKTTLAFLMAGLLEPTSGTVFMNGCDIRDLNLDYLRQNIALVSDPDEIFEGTVEENITLGRDIPLTKLHQVLDLLCLTPRIAAMPNGLKTRLVSAGRNISLGQRQKILVARAILNEPQLLILDEAFTGVDQHTKVQILDNLIARENPWTILNISHDPAVILRSDITHVLHNGTIIESGSPKVLAVQKESAFAHLFPEITYKLSQKVKV